MRCYFHKARNSHFCDHCFHFIEPGERYSGTVIAMAGHIIVMKRHDNCPVDPYEEERRMMEQIEEWEEMEQDDELAIAA